MDGASGTPPSLSSLFSPFLLNVPARVCKKRHRGQTSDTHTHCPLLFIAMISLTTFLTIYLFGGLTFLPVLLLAAFYVFSSDLQSPLQPSNKRIYPQEEYEDVDPDQGKKGWIRLTNQQDGAISGRFLTTHNNNSQGTNNKKHKDLVYGLLKHGTLFVYESDRLLECKMIIPVHDFTVSIYPEGKRDHEVFNKSTAIRLRPKHLRRHQTINGLTMPRKADVVKSKTDTDLLDSKAEEDEAWALDQDIYLLCGRSIDKEDWYFALISASNFMADSPTQVEAMNSTHFDMNAMQDLIKNIHHDPKSRQIQWLNAILGRMFLGMYKTDKVQTFFEQKITKKVSKMKRPVFIDEIAVHRVQVGHAIPYLNHPKLLSLALDGSLTAEGQIDYDGGLCVEIETGFLWSYSSRTKPIRVRLILSVTLKRFTGRFLFKIKAPPTNRYWIGFYEPPVMDLVIKPIVSDKQIKLNVVTNAIESKIREVIAETMVLPNMDDFVFCDSGGKGGIFGHEPPPSPPPVHLSSAPAPSSIRSEPPMNNKDDTKSGSNSRRSSSASSPPAPHTSESMPPSVRRSDSAKSPESLHVLPNDISKSSPELLSGSQSDPVAKTSGETASIVSQDSSDSSSSVPSSSIRWPSSMNLRRKKRGSDAASIASSEKNDDEADDSVSIITTSSRSVGSKRSFLSRIKSEISDEIRTGERKPLYQKAETIWQRSKEVTREFREREEMRLKEEAEHNQPQPQPQHIEQLPQQKEQQPQQEQQPNEQQSPQQQKEVLPHEQTPPQERSRDGNNAEHAPQLEENTRISRKPPPPPRPARRRSSVKEEDKPPLPPRVHIEPIPEVSPSPPQPPLGVVPPLPPRVSVTSDVPHTT
ncbi:putative integral membrane protein conserved region-domain-containing protein [Fennellomyces sp. T-0311]|nr:putative integral membrane protein conserved region-domain-containing protein [Fennellomyces sp. T-0311]